MTRKQKKMLCRIIAAGILLITALLLPTDGILRLVSFLIPYLLIGYDVIADAFRGIINGQLLDENFLMVIASIGAIIIGEYPECVAVMLFYQVGELFQSIAVGRSRKSISDLMDICP
ncbi:MAG: heavy metal translocating P-type ATPase, partial [Christensenellaceae bacterium]|nr:heavy metal translocating P-type ATPase [Christensenellaceae bacterium]